MIDRVSTSNFRTKLIVSPSKDMVVHHNWLKLCYGTPQEVTAPSGQSPATRCLYSDVVCWYIPDPAGRYTSSASNPLPDSTLTTQLS